MKLLFFHGGLVHRLGCSSRRTCAALGLRRKARWGATHAPPIASIFNPSGLIRLILLPAFFLVARRLTHVELLLLITTPHREATDSVVAAACPLVARSVRSRLASTRWCVSAFRRVLVRSVLRVLGPVPQNSAAIAHRTAQARQLAVHCLASPCSYTLLSSR